MIRKMAHIFSLLIKPMDCLLYVFIGPFTVLYIIPQFLLDLETDSLLHGFGINTIALVGRAFMLSGALLAIWCGLVMKIAGKGTPFVTSPPTSVLQKGIYSYSRNPMMLAIILTLFGEALNFGSLLLFVWLLAWGRAGHLIVVQYEEPQLERRFGEEYVNYCKQVNRWIPLFKKTAFQCAKDKDCSHSSL